MTLAIGPPVYAAKARRALAAARLLLKEGETEGTCNRAYYAMYYAAHVALAEFSDTKEVYKTHHGLVAAFGRLVVRQQLIDPRFGRSFNDIQKLRELSDYLGDPPSVEDATAALAEAEAFVAAIAAKWPASEICLDE